MKRPNPTSMVLLFAVLGASIASAEPAPAQSAPDRGTAAAAPGKLDEAGAKAELDASAAASQAELGMNASASQAELDASAAASQAELGMSAAAPQTEVDVNAAASQAEQTRRRRGRVIGLTVLAAGAVGLVVGAAYGASAYSDWHSASVACGGDTEHCRSAGYVLAQRQLDSARRSATISSWSIGGGLATAAVGVAMLVASRARPIAAPAPATAWRAAPTVGPEAVGFVLTRSLP